ncbi:hypothetical protein HPB50_022150 [Hyalomma asiaticum]|uniref:Uncharacterized protein n=1 Tax=Hyalomma asiaticum TaxID=266040 RepID=A0ACB7T8U9_HYAAI|nr:hypothetical protein HPB50_022150 [Hyalomma asiaticum]
MAQRRLAHFLILHVRKKGAAELHLDAVMKEFVSRAPVVDTNSFITAAKCSSAARTATFGLL